MDSVGLLDPLLLAQLFIDAPAPIIAIDGAGTILFTTKEFANLLGCTPADIVGRPLASCGAPEDTSRIDAAILHAFREQYHDGLTLRLACADGSTVEYGARVRLVHTPDAAAILLLSLNIEMARYIVPSLSADLLRTLLNRLPVELWIRDREGRMAFMTSEVSQQRGTRIFGKTVEESEVSEELRAHWSAINTRALAGETVRDEFSENRDGEIRHYLGVTTGIHSGPNAGYLVGMHVDVTELHRTQAALEASEARIRVVLESMPVELWMRDPDGKIMLQSGLSRVRYGDRTGQMLDSSVDRAVYERWSAQNVRALAGETVRELITEVVDGEARVSEELIFAIHEGPLTGALVGITTDVTKQQRLANALRESEEYFRLTFDQAPIGAAIVSLQSQFLRVNDSFCALVGYSRAALIGMPEADLIYPDDRTHAQELQRQLVDGEITQYRHEERYVRAGGAIGWVAVFSRLVYDQTGAPRYFLNMIEDIDARRKADAALLATKEAAEAADRAKSAFLAAMSHELRTPLNAVLGNTELLSEEIYGPITRNQSLALERINMSAHHLLDLINDVLDLAKVEAAREVLELTSIELLAICERAIELVRVQATARNITISLSHDPRLTVVMLDERRVLQIIVNLLSNAVKFTPEGGQIGIETIANPDTHELFLTVWDTGIGIAAADIAHIFEPFTQLDQRLSRTHTGTGLGLALVQQLTALHGGHVTVTSSVGVGSRFTVCLPWRHAVT